jgi:O-antigen ligase
MNAFQLYFVVYTFLRSLSNGVDRMYDTSFSLPLSLTAIVIGFAGAWHTRNVTIHRRIFTLLTCLSVFIVSSGLSLAVNSFGASDLIGQYAVDQYTAWYEIFRYAYLMMFVMLVSAVYQRPSFCQDVHRTYLLLLFVISAVGLVQHLTGNTMLVTQHDAKGLAAGNLERVAGLSSNPVPFSLEIVLTFFICELSRRKLRLAIGYLHIAVYSLFLVALILSAARTGVAILGVSVGIFLIVQRPLLLPVFAAAFALLMWLTPFGELFSELRSVPEYILRGEYVVWDWRTAVTSVHWRIHQWYYLSTLALDRPWIGFGPGQVTLYSPFSLLAHSQFVEIFFETGTVGLISFAAFWFSIPWVAMSDRRRLVISYGKRSAEVEALHLWIAMFAGVTLVATFDQSFNRETVAFSHLIVSVFLVLAQPEAVTNREPRSRYSHVSLRYGSRIEALGSRGTEPQLGR